MNKKVKSKDNKAEKVNYEDIYSEHKKQKIVTSIFAKLLNIRKQILENRENTTNPSNLNGLLRSSYNVHDSIVNYSSGI